MTTPHTDPPGRALADPIAMEVLSNRFMSIVESMLKILVRSSFSTNIKERRDCSVGLFDSAGRVLAQTEHTPLHLGSTLGSVEQILQEFPRETILAGDAFISNDPYLAGGTHLPDITVVSPVFHEGGIEFFVATIAHHSDVGGVVPGSISGNSGSIFHEGIRIPTVRIREAGQLQQNVLRLISANTRDPDERSLDIGVQLTTNDCGAAMVRELIGQMGIDAMKRSIEDLIEYTRLRLKTRIAALPAHSASAQAILDDDGSGAGPVHIRVKAEARDGSLVVDFAGTDPQAKGAMNVPWSALRATLWYVVKMMLDPTIMPNHGISDCISIRTQPRTIVSPEYPAAVGARSITCNKVSRAVIAALGQLLPFERRMAAGHDIVPAICFAGRRQNDDSPYVYLETVGGGAAGMAVKDGMDGVQLHVTNTSNLPAEALETEYRLLVDEYALVPDSSGAGAHRGGLGIARQIRAMEDGVVFSARSDGHVFPAPGAEGGRDGRPARLLRNPNSNREERLNSKVAGITLSRGESIRIETPGGGGFGPPESRPVELIAADLRSGKISRDEAIRSYGARLVNLASAASRDVKV
jgi:N-methylhydantoinase B